MEQRERWTEGEEGATWRRCWRNMSGRSLMLAQLRLKVSVRLFFFLLPAPPSSSTSPHHLSVSVSVSVDRLVDLSVSFLSLSLSPSLSLSLSLSLPPLCPRPRSLEACGDLPHAKPRGTRAPAPPAAHATAPRPPGLGCRMRCTCHMREHTPNGMPPNYSQEPKAGWGRGRGGAHL